MFHIIELLCFKKKVSKVIYFTSHWYFSEHLFNIQTSINKRKEERKIMFDKICYETTISDDAIVSTLA